MVVPCCNTIHYQYQLYDSESDYNNLGVYKGVSAKKKGLKQNMEKYNDFNCDILKWRGDEKSTTQTSYVSYTGGGADVHYNGLNCVYTGEEKAKQRPQLCHTQGGRS